MDRPSRSQHNLLEFIEQFVAQHGYGPSYREIMKALEYKSVSTVAIHINGLIAKRKLQKHGRSARSLEVVPAGLQTTKPNLDPEDWLVKKIEAYAASPDVSQAALYEIARSVGHLGLVKAQTKATSYLAKS